MVINPNINSNEMTKDRLYLKQAMLYKMLCYDASCKVLKHVHKVK